MRAPGSRASCSRARRAAGRRLAPGGPPAHRRCRQRSRRPASGSRAARRPSATAPASRPRAGRTGLHRLRAPGADKAVEAQYLALAQREGDIGELGRVGRAPRPRGRLSPIGTSRFGNTCSIERPTMRRTSSAASLRRSPPSPTCSPSRRQAQRSATRKISSNLCEMKRMARPSALSCATMRKSSSISRAESAAVGSSMMTMRASCDKRAGDLDQVLLRDAEFFSGVSASISPRGARAAPSPASASRPVDEPAAPPAYGP